LLHTNIGKNAARRGIFYSSIWFSSCSIAPSKSSYLCEVRSSNCSNCLRSPYYDCDYMAAVVNFDGFVDNYYVGLHHFGVVPALWINL